MRLKTTASAIAISAALFAHNAAAQTERVRFAIEAKPVTLALQEFAGQSGYQMAFLTDAAANVRSQSVSGVFAPEVALRRLLEGTGLEYRLINESTIAILRKTAEAENEGRAEERSLRYASASDQSEGSAPIQQFAQAQLQTAQAQTQAATDESEELEEIVVTGSRLAGTNLTSPVPVYQVSSEEIDVRGAARIEDVLNILPQTVPSQTAEVSGSDATGTATLDLRGLGAIRTLVLVDGKRLPFGSPQSSPSNLDIIPAQLIERIDIVTGGASAVYGADAVGGVANFILKDDFEGVEIDSQVGFHQAPNDREFMEAVAAASGIETPDSTSDGRDVFATMLLGVNTPDNKGNVTAFVGYQNLNIITGRDRDGGTCPLSASTGPFSFKGVRCSGSSNFRRFTLEDGTDLFQQEDGTLKLFEGGPNELFNFEPDVNLQRPQERFTINARGYYEFMEDTEVYTDLSFMNNDTTGILAPTATFNRPFQVNCDNPLLDNGLGPEGEGIGTLFELFRCDEVLTALEAGEPNPVTGEENDIEVPFTNSHRFVEGDNPGRVFNTDLTTWRLVLGLRGTIANRFDWDVFGQFSRVVWTETTANDAAFQKVQQALFVVEDEEGNLVCRDQRGGCVPWNIFGRTPDGQSLVTDESLNFVLEDGLVTGQTEQQVVGGTIQGELGDFGVRFPGAESGISLLVGWEYREDTLEVTPDSISKVEGGLGLIGQGAAELPVQGRLEVFELLMETQIPLIENKPFIDRWLLSGAYRRSEYNVNGLDFSRNRRPVTNEFSTDTWFVGTSWSPTDDLRFRAQFQRAIRAPNVIELFTGLNTGNFDFRGDPCAGPNPEATFEQCARTGVTQSQFGNIPTQPAQEFNQVTGGNPDLQPEVADTVTVGAIFTPSAISGLSLSVDYFNIEIEDTIDTVPPQTTLTECLETGNPQFCDLIDRDRFGSLFLDSSNFQGVQATNVNIATLETSGVDFSLKYEMPLSDVGLDDLGSVNFDYAATWTTEFEEVPLPGGDIIDCQGKFGDECTTPQPEYRHRLMASWNAPWGMQLTTTWRHIGDTDFVNDPAPSPIDEKQETQEYIDLVIRQQVTDNLWLRLGINNLFNTNPPLSTVAGSGTTAGGNTFPGLFDPDRFIFFGVNISM